MIGAILQLVANDVNIQDYYFTGKPQITFWKQLYRRHTPFSSESVAIQPISKANFGEIAKFKIGKKADLAGISYIEFEIPELEAVFPKRSEILRLFGSKDVFELLETIDTDIEYAEKMKGLNIHSLDTFPQYKLINYLKSLNRYTVLPDDPALQEIIYNEWLKTMKIPTLEEKLILQNQLEFLQQWNRDIIVYKLFGLNGTVYNTVYEPNCVTDKLSLLVCEEIASKIDRLFEIYPLDVEFTWVDHRRHFWLKLGYRVSGLRQVPYLDLSRITHEGYLLDFPINLLCMIYVNIIKYLFYRIYYQHTTN